MPSHRPTHYERLKVQPDAPTIVIRAAYRALAFRHHPDRRGPDVRPEDHEEMARLNTAYRVLMDPSQRLAYDAELASLSIPAFEPFQVPQYAASPAQTYAVARHERHDPGPQTRVDLDWAEPTVPAKPRRVSRREWVLLGSLVLLTAIGGGWTIRQANLRASAERALAERVMSSTAGPAVPAAAAVNPPRARAALGPAPATHASRTVLAAQEDEHSTLPPNEAPEPPPDVAADALTFVLPAKKTAQADGADQAEEADEAGTPAQAGDDTAARRALPAKPAAPREAVAEATPREKPTSTAKAEGKAENKADKRPAPTRATADAAPATRTPHEDESDPAALLERHPAAAGRPTRAASAAAPSFFPAPQKQEQRHEPKLETKPEPDPAPLGNIQPISFHQLDGRPLDLKSAGGLPEMQGQAQPPAPPRARRGPPAILR